MSDGASNGGPEADATITALFDAGTASQDESSDEVVENAVEILRTRFDMDVAFVSAPREGGRTVTALDAETDDLFAASGSPAPQESAAHVPIELPDGDRFGVLRHLGARSEESLSERDVALMRVFAEMIADSVSTERAALRRRRRLQRVVSGAIDEGSMSVVFQPIVDLRRERAVGYEALARFEGGGDPSPGRWFAAATESGMREDLEIAAVEQALASLAAVPGDSYLSLNVSPQVVASGRLADALSTAPAGRILIEITEHEMVSAYDDLAVSLGSLRRAGVAVAVDDAGAGFSSFRHILQLRPEVIKMDMSITRGIDEDPARRALASAFVAFARDTGSVLVAEGVETDAEVVALDELGVVTAQGFELGRPGPLPGD